MKIVSAALIACWAVLAAAQSGPQTAASLAPSLEALEKVAPEAHRTLADGTYDLMPFRDRFVFVGEFLKQCAGGEAADPANLEALDRELAATWESFESLHGMNDPAVEAAMNKMLFQILTTMDSSMALAEAMRGDVANPSVERAR